MTGRIRADDSIFDRRRGVPDHRRGRFRRAAPLSGLSFNSGIAHGHYAKNPELVAARALRRKLRAKGVRVKGGTGRADLPRRALASRRLEASARPRSTS